MPNRQPIAFVRAVRRPPSRSANLGTVGLAMTSSSFDLGAVPVDQQENAHLLSLDDRLHVSASAAWCAGRNSRRPW